MVGVRLAIATIPFPVRATDWGLSLALSVIVIAPVRVPVVVGLKVTEIMQFPPAATELPQVLVWAKSPLAAILVMLNVELPVFVSVTFWAGVVLLTYIEPKFRLVGDRLTTGAVARAAPPKDNKSPEPSMKRRALRFSIVAQVPPISFRVIRFTSRPYSICIASSIRWLARAGFR